MGHLDLLLWYKEAGEVFKWFCIARVLQGFVIDIVRGSSFAYSCQEWILAQL